MDCLSFLRFIILLPLARPVGNGGIRSSAPSRTSILPLSAVAQIEVREHHHERDLHQEGRAADGWLDPQDAEQDRHQRLGTERDPQPAPRAVRLEPAALRSVDQDDWDAVRHVATSEDQDRQRRHLTAAVADEGSYQ